MLISFVSDLIEGRSSPASLLQAILLQGAGNTISWPQGKLNEIEEFVDLLFSCVVLLKK